MVDHTHSISTRAFHLSHAQIHWILFFTILLVGIFARIWGFGRVPPGLNADEASIGVEANSLYRYGMDRNGVSYPVNFIAWGSGQNALYGYLLIPFVAMLGLSPSVVRLPMLLTGILSLPLIYLAGRKTWDAGFGLLTMFFLSVSPWHIILSRWALESNLLPFVFLSAYVCLLEGLQNWKWLLPAGGLFGLSLYAYGTAYAVVPAFLALTAMLLWRTNRIPRRYVVRGLLAFVLVALPIGLFVLVNARQMNSISIGAITIPRFPVQVRFQSETIFSSSSPLQAILQNIWHGITLLTVQTDELPYNILDPYGYFYTVTFPLAILGIALLLRGSAGEGAAQRQLLVSWVAASSLVAVLQQVNVNRFNIIFIPLIICIALSIRWLSGRFRLVLPISIIVLLVGLFLFMHAYHSKEYRQETGLTFHDGLLQALAFARNVGQGPICVDDNNMPYIFVLFSVPQSPREYLANLRYEDPEAPLRPVLSLGRYTFGRGNCLRDPAPTYILIAGSAPPSGDVRYKVQFFDRYAVYYPKP